VLEAIEADVLHPDVIEPALAEALDLVRHPAVVAPAQAAALTDELRQIEAELANLLKTAKAVGPLPALVAEMHAAEQRRAGIQRALKPTPSIPTTDAATVRALLADWRTLFQAPENITLARQVLRQLFTERATWTPQIDGAERFYHFRAACSLGKVGGSVCHKWW
jgi:hypothetical protein